MRYEIEKPEFSPITVTFDRQEEVIWLMGILVCNGLCEAIRKVDPAADRFLDNLYNAIKSGDPSDKSYKLANKLDAEL